MKLSRLILFTITAVLVLQLLFTTGAYALGGNKKPPILELTADRETITLGESATLTWSSELADTCQISPDLSQSTSCSGSQAVSPLEGTTYTFSATNDDGDSSVSVTIIVTIPDEDNDGVPDTSDTCPNTPDGETVDDNGCSSSQRDSDNDGLTDNLEDVNNNGVVDAGETDLFDPDTDDDGLNDGLEVNTHGTNPLLKDSDSDGLADAIEIQNSAEPCSMDPLNQDDASQDCDGDTYSNMVELLVGSNRNSSSSYPRKKSNYQYDDKGRIQQVIKQLQ